MVSCVPVACFSGRRFAVCLLWERRSRCDDRNICCSCHRSQSLREEDSFQLFPRLGLGLTLLDMVCWIGTYIWGFLS